MVQAIRCTPEEIGAQPPPLVGDRVLVRYTGPAIDKVRACCALGARCLLSVHRSDVSGVQAKPYDCYWVTPSELAGYRQSSDHVLVRYCSAAQPGLKQSFTALRNCICTGRILVAETCQFDIQMCSRFCCCCEHSLLRMWLRCATFRLHQCRHGHLRTVPRASAFVSAYNMHVMY